MTDWEIDFCSVANDLGEQALMPDPVRTHDDAMRSNKKRSERQSGSALLKLAVGQYRIALQPVKTALPN